MTDAAHGLSLEADRPPRVGTGPLTWMRANLFGSVGSTILTVLAAWLIAVAVPPFVRWALIDAVWHAASGRDCRGGGACWAFIGEKLRFILFGRFPYDQQWRPLSVVVIFIGLILASCRRELWGRGLMALWVGGLAIAGLLMGGGAFGLDPVATDLWNGLPLTLI